MNLQNARRQLTQDGYTHEEIEERIDELLDENREEDEPPKPGIDEMTLRDLMAMFALIRGWEADKKKLANDAYATADAMIEERKKNAAKNNP